jgi:hypothetical protein
MSQMGGLPPEIMSLLMGQGGPEEMQEQQSGMPAEMGMGGIDPSVMEDPIIAMLTQVLMAEIQRKSSSGMGQGQGAQGQGGDPGLDIGSAYDTNDMGMM